MSLTPAQLAPFIDHAQLKPETSQAQIEKLCAEALEHKFFSVCVNGSWVATAYHLLEDSDVKVTSIVLANQPPPRRSNNTRNKNGNFCCISMVYASCFLRGK
jgi:deoxyribose-phosphate aldolase